MHYGGSNVNKYAYVIRCSNPTVYDSITEGISDADSDNDGLFNISEIELGTNPLIADSDNDKLSDGE